MTTSLRFLGIGGDKALERIRDFVRTIRQGPRERVVAFFGAVCFAAPLIPQIRPILNLFGISAYAYGFYLLGAISYLWVFYRVWRLAVPTASPSLEPRPTAIKGPGAFGAQDGVLFRRLGREAELRALYGHVLDDAVGLVIVVGESGAGKTSLLRAGLANVLEQSKIGYAYWEAVPSEPENGLLHAINNTVNIPAEQRPLDFEQLVKFDGSSQRLVIVLDQLEQLREGDPRHRVIFDHLREMVTGSPPPHHVTWVVAFRRDYEPDWRDFEDSIANFHPPRSSLRLFTAPQAQAVMATIAEEAGFSLPSALLKDLTEAIAQDNRISPVDIGITMLALHELARDRLDTELTVQQYRLAGGAEGLLTNYIQQALERYKTSERNSVLLALLSLADPSSDRRIAEGKTLDELSDAARTANARLGPMLSYLASPAVPHHRDLVAA
jgi:energy-coupling factor transporter ATP-binding protein EcfA2